MKFIVDLWLDGYEDEAESDKAAEEFIYDQLNFTASAVKIGRLDDLFDKEIPEGDNDFTKGYKQAIEDLKREIYE